MLAQIKVAKTKGALSCVGASRRCPPIAVRKRDGRKLAALKHPAVLIRLRSALLGAAPKGTEYRQRPARYRFAMKIAKRASSDNAEGESDRNVTKHRNFDLVAVPTLLLGRPRLYSGPVWRDEKRRTEGCPAHGAGAASCLRIAKAIRA